jgi:hypothetical protein
METVIKLTEIDFIFFEKLKQQFGDQEVTIRIEARSFPSDISEAFENMKAYQNKYPIRKIDSSINLQDLIKESHQTTSLFS